MSYAWIIDRDHLNEDSPLATGSDVGMMGPHDAPEWMTDVLARKTTGHVGGNPGAHISTFRMYDDDGELYYTGRMITDEGDTEEACYGPLADYGMPGAGCTSIKYHGHPEMDCG